MSTDEQIRQIARELSRIARQGKVLPGSITERQTYCGHAGCACQDRPPRPHGPYWQWTRKVAGKTVTRRLSAEQAANYERWIENDRRIRELVGRLETIAITSIEAARPAERARRA